MGTAPNPRNDDMPGRGRPQPPDQSPAEMPEPPARKEDPDRQGRWPPGGLPNPMPGVDPQQTPGIDRLGDAGPEQQVWVRSWRTL